jgi:hypothetical protein
MKAFDLITLLDPAIVADQTKIHLAIWNGQDDPLDLYRLGKFEEWQRSQARLNFGRSFVLSLIKLPGRSRWLFAGVHNSNGSATRESSNLYYYRLSERLACSELSGRLIVLFERPGRQSYLYAEKWVEQIHLAEILPEPVRLPLS